MSLGAAPQSRRSGLRGGPRCHPQTIAVVTTRAEARGVKVVVADVADYTFGPGVAGCLLQYPTRWGRSSTIGRWSSGSSRSGGSSRSPPICSRSTLLTPSGRVGRRYRRGQLAALRGAARVRRAARGVSRDPGRVQAADPRTPDRSVPGPGGPSGAAHGAADPRAAHPPGKGDQQRLHGAGAPGGNGQHVCRLSRARGHCRHRGAGARPDDAACRRPARPGLPARERGVLRYARRRDR